MTAIELETVAEDWQLSLDAAASALDASGRGVFPPQDLAERRRRLADERQEARESLASLGRAVGAREQPWVAAFPIRASHVGLPDGVRACLFDLEGVVTDSGRLHAAAWAEVFDDFLVRRSGREGMPFIPFDTDADYGTYVEGRLRLDGIRIFLRSRGIAIPEGRPSDPASADTEYGLARHKSEALGRQLRRRGVTALPGARRYLEAVARAGLGCAVVSSSATTMPMLELAGVVRLVDERVDAATIESAGLQARPAPDIVVAACGLLGVEPAAAVSFTHSADGLVAAQAAGVRTIGVGIDDASRARLSAYGAERVVGSLSELLDARLRVAA